MRRFPAPIQQAVAAFTHLPGVGPKTALRYVYTLLKQPKTDTEQFARAVFQLVQQIKTCTRCHTYTDYDGLCEICKDQTRHKHLLCVVEESRDIATMEATGLYKGYYHVLGGVLAPMEGITPQVLTIASLGERLTQTPEIQEVILALPPTMAGETTLLYLMKHLAPHQKKLTRLARGLPVGATLEYADEITLGDAFAGRQDLK